MLYIKMIQRFKGSNAGPSLTTLAQHLNNIVRTPDVCISQVMAYHFKNEQKQDGEMDEVTLPSRHRMLNSNPGGLRPSTLLSGHGGFPQ